MIILYNMPLKVSGTELKVSLNAILSVYPGCDSETMMCRTNVAH